MQIKSGDTIYDCRYKMTRGKCSYIEVSKRTVGWFGIPFSKVLHTEPANERLQRHEKLKHFFYAVRKYEQKLKDEIIDNELEQQIHNLDQYV